MNNKRTSVINKAVIEGLLVSRLVTAQVFAKEVLIARICGGMLYGKKAK
jgi:hypothetical protein